MKATAIVFLPQAAARSSKAGLEVHRGMATGPPTGDALASRSWATSCCEPPLG